MIYWEIENVMPAEKSNNIIPTQDLGLFSYWLLSIACKGYWTFVNSLKIIFTSLLFWISTHTSCFYLKCNIYEVKWWLLHTVHLCSRRSIKAFTLLILYCNWLTSCTNLITAIVLFPKDVYPDQAIFNYLTRGEAVRWTHCSFVTLTVLCCVCVVG